ncbi:Uncharacterised protein [Mycobacteroides abscessus subsp. abscessus]|nr:Uncharacterised protein [Mycobacteroides abscessus subsp. abscessus]
MSLRIFDTGPFAFTCPLASPTATLYSPRQNLLPLSADIDMRTSGVSSLSPSMTAMAGSFRTTVIDASGAE